MADFYINMQEIQPSVFEQTFNNIGVGFQEIMNTLEKVNSHNTITVQDGLAMQTAVFKYGYFQEMVTKISSKSATSINDVMKSQ